MKARGFQAFHRDLKVQQAKGGSFPHYTERPYNRNAAFFGLAASLPVINNQLSSLEFARENDCVALAGVQRG